MLTKPPVPYDLCVADLRMELFEALPATRLPVAVGLHGPLHDEEPGQQVDEDPPDPGRHQVGLGRPEVDVEHHDRDADAATHHIQHQESKYFCQDSEWFEEPEIDFLVVAAGQFIYCSSW